jgi:hypothetical protein
MNTQPDQSESVLRWEETTTVWLCSVHYHEFWMPHGGRCPASGCEQELVPFTRRVAFDEDRT